MNSDILERYDDDDDDDDNNNDSNNDFHDIP